MNKDAVVAGQAIYSKKVLSIYDLWVLGFSNHYLWKCPTRLIGAEFTKLASANHLDVGVGSGYYLKKHLPATSKRIALVDLNQNSLDTASKVVAALQPEVYCRNVLEPLGLDCDKFDSISANFLLHCLPGNFSEKGVVFQHLGEVLNDGGVLFGSTILGKGVPKGPFASKLMAIYNKKGIFSNENDDLEGLLNALNAHFSDVKVEVVGCVALFFGRKG